MINNPKTKSINNVYTNDCTNLNNITDSINVSNKIKIKILEKKICLCLSEILMI
jgi:hypothetical protein